MPAESKTVELLAPAGSFEKLEIAVHYGADAVYLGDPVFSLRRSADNFTPDQMRRAAAYTRSNGVKLYVACNIYPNNYEAAQLADYFKTLSDIRPDALIIADPGVFMTARQVIPDIPIHLSTQANTTSIVAARFWESLGVRRINLARELSLSEIKEITDSCGVEIEAFVHGAACIAYSGRCLLSSFLTGRDSNRGQCSHPCRWRYHLMETSRPGQYMPVIEDDRGTYVFSAKDLCMIDHVDKMIAAGITALKIEGRMRSLHYLATTVKAYREAIDDWYRDPDRYRADDNRTTALASVNTRGFCTNFYFGRPGPSSINHTDQSSSGKYVFLAKVLGRDRSGRTVIQVKNKLFRDESVQIIRPRHPTALDILADIRDEAGNDLKYAQPNSVAAVRLSVSCRPNDLIRRA